MKKILSLLVFSYLIFIAQIICADSQNANITLTKYYRAQCQDYTGTWSGFMTDPGDLVGNGGAWPFSVNLYYKNGSLIGQVNQNGSNQNSQKKIWAQCSNGALSNIFWGNRGDCGSFSQQGLLVSQNVLVLQLHYESAMTGTDFLVFLTRINNKYPSALSSSDMILGNVTSCH